MIDAMKYDYIYSEAVEIITGKKDDGTKFLSKDTLCVAVTEDDKLYSAFNTINMVDGKPVTGSSEKEVIKKISGGDGSKRIEAMITMNCVEMIPVLPAQEDVDEIIKLDKYNAATYVVSPNNKYISLTSTASRSILQSLLHGTASQLQESTVALNTL